MATELTGIALVLDTATAVALTALGDDGTAETFEYVPGVPCDRVVLVFDNLEQTEDLAVSISAGDYWQYTVGANAFTVSNATKKFLILTGARHKDKDDNKITIVMTPNAGAAVAAELGAVELPPATLLSEV